MQNEDIIVNEDIKAIESNPFLDNSTNSDQFVQIDANNLVTFDYNNVAITDIVNSNSEALVLGKRTDIVEKAYNVKLENNKAFLPGVVSRKKQMLPIMQENA